MALSGTELLEYAHSKFQGEKYDEALEAFVLAYMKGIEQQWVIETIYNCYMKGNEKEFHNAFQRYAGKINVAFENCLLDFIPYRDGEYFIFDKRENVFRGKFSIKELEKTVPDPSFQDVEFSAAAWEMDWDWRKFQNILIEAGKRKIYVICHDLERAVSFCKIPELVKYMDYVMLFSCQKEFKEYFHKNTGIYLPRVLTGDNDFGRKLAYIIEEEHQYRLTPEGRDIENVLLTIAIPTYNRGNLLKKRLENLQQMPYDAEVEIVISKNGMERYQEEYDEVSRIQDARIQYHDHGKTLLYMVNWHYAVEMAHGKYVLFVSDEDDVAINAMEHYLRLLVSHPEASMIRAKTCVQNPYLEKGYGKKGLEAFKLMFLGQNYLSGLIVRREHFLEEELLRLQIYSDNPFYKNYPHEWWCALLTRKGAAINEPVILIEEGESALKKEDSNLKQSGDSGICTANSLPLYATYESRFAQFQGQIGFLRWFMAESLEGAALGMQLAIGKLAHLLELARELEYDVGNFLNTIDRFAGLCMDGVDGFHFDDNQKVELLEWIEWCCRHMFECHSNLNAENVENGNMKNESF